MMPNKRKKSNNPKKPTTNERLEKVEKLLEALVKPVDPQDPNQLEISVDKEISFRQPLLPDGENEKEGEKGVEVTGEEPPCKKIAPSAAAGGPSELAAGVGDGLSLDKDAVSVTLNKMLGVDKESKGEVPNAYFVAGTTVDVKLKRKIWNKEYVDLGALIPKNENNQTKVNFGFAPGYASQMSFTPNKPPLPANVTEWVSWFSTFAAIYTEKYPSEAPYLFTYMQRVINISRSHYGTYIWRTYDEKFRRLKQFSDSLPWHLQDHHVLQDAKDAVAQPRVYHNRPQRGRSTQQNSNQQLNDGKSGPCYAYNRRSGCMRPITSCRYRHECTSCQGPHPIFRCTKPSQEVKSATTKKSSQ